MFGFKSFISYYFKTKRGETNISIPHSGKDLINMWNLKESSGSNLYNKKSLLSQ